MRRRPGTFTGGRGKCGREGGGQEQASRQLRQTHIGRSGRRTWPKDAEETRKGEKVANSKPATTVHPPGMKAIVRLSRAYNYHLPVISRLQRVASGIYINK